MAKDIVLQACRKHLDKFIDVMGDYESRGILYSEMLAVCSLCDELRAEVIIDSGRARGQSAYVMARYFQNAPVRIVSIDWDDTSSFIPEDDQFARQRLASCENVEVLYGDSCKVVREVVANNSGKRIAVLLDGPKGQVAIDLMCTLFRQSGDIVAGFIHDMMKGPPERRSMQSTFPSAFFTDDKDYLQAFSALDESCIKSLNWTPYWHDTYGHLSSYGPTLAVVLASSDDIAAVAAASGSGRCQRNLFKEKLTVRGILRYLVPTRVKRAIRSHLQSVIEDTLASAPCSTNMQAGRHARHKIVKHAMMFCRYNRVEGNYFEFGTWKGDTFQHAFHTALELRLYGMHFFAFDSFEGFSQPQTTDDIGLIKEASRACSEESFLENMRTHNVDPDRMTSVKGWFSDTLNDETKERILTNVTSKKAALAYIDCDLFEPVIAALDFLTDLLVDGSVIIFDDWFFLRAHPNRGERRAFVEWQRKNPQFTVTEYAKFGWHGCAFIINTK